MPQHKIVARYRDGRVLKGHTNNFFPTSPSFVLELHDQPGAKPVPVEIHDLKAIFFVKDFLGRTNYQRKNEFSASQPYQGRRIRVTFLDGETVAGSTPEYNPNAQGFFLFPADMDANTIKAYVVNEAVHQANLLPQQA